MTVNVQRFHVSHLREEDFQGGGLRSYAKYRDFGFAEATGGIAQAHVIRMIPPRTDEVSVWHSHNVSFQMVYVLKGWIMSEFDGEGPHLMRKGSAWIQPPNIKHIVHDYSDDCELLEVILPADFRTTNTGAGEPKSYEKPELA